MTPGVRASPAPPDFASIHVAVRNLVAQAFPDCLVRSNPGANPATPLTVTVTWPLDRVVHSVRADAPVVDKFAAERFAQKAIAEFRRWYDAIHR